jgi:hypothetical protein
MHSFFVCFLILLMTLSYSAQLLFLDGRLSAGLLHLLPPKFAVDSFYMRYVYPLSVTFLKVKIHSVAKVLRDRILFLILFCHLSLQVVGKWVLVQWLCGFLFCVLVCLTQPHSRGRLLREQNADIDDPTFQKPLILGKPALILIKNKLPTNTL